MLVLRKRKKEKREQQTQNQNQNVASNKEIALNSLNCVLTSVLSSQERAP